MKTSNFRNWCYEKWYEHQQEIEEWTHTQPKYTYSYYFNKYRWWLKSEYKKLKK